jgi:hypothetical protein
VSISRSRSTRIRVSFAFSDSRPGRRFTSTGSSVRSAGVSYMWLAR